MDVAVPAGVGCQRLRVTPRRQPRDLQVKKKEFLAGGITIEHGSQFRISHSRDHQPPGSLVVEQRGGTGGERRIGVCYVNEQAGINDPGACQSPSRNSFIQSAVVRATQPARRANPIIALAPSGFS